MKIKWLLPLVLSLPAFAGDPVKDSAAPAAGPCDWSWFAGGSIGYLTELEEPMYHLHLGTDTCWNLGGWNVALFSELGYAEKDESWSGRPEENDNGFIPEITQETVNGEDPDFGDFDSGSLNDLDSALSDVAANTPFDTGYDFDVLPITLNVKLERPLTGNLNAYFGGGLGVALVDLSFDAGEFDFSDDDWVFVGQLFAGVNYNFTPSVEMYGGARWIYFDDAELSDGGEGGTLELDDDFLFEIGARFNF